MNNKWEDYYYAQAFPEEPQRGGSSFPIFRPPIFQRGYGIGNLFKSLARTVMPTLKEGLKTLGKSALQTGMDVLQDVSRGENLKTAATKRLKQNTLGLLDDTLSRMTSRKTINKKQRQRNPISSKRARKRKRQTISKPLGEDIFTQLDKRRKI
tara:strand:+ start:519 stop:977 length:459 start_codon:yes stop_codon:yes gene_type:complete